MDVPGETPKSPPWIVLTTPSKVTVVRAWREKFSRTLWVTDSKLDAEDRLVLGAELGEDGLVLGWPLGDALDRLQRFRAVDLNLWSESTK
jgi:hypothetical protein